MADIHVLFEPDTIVPSEFFASVRRQAPTKQGEYRLLLAVLEDAITCFQDNVHAVDKWKQRLFDEAQEWITGEAGDRGRQGADQMPGFSFEYVCEVLGLDAAYLRGGLQRWRTGLDRHRRQRPGSPQLLRLPK